MQRESDKWYNWKNTTNSAMALKNELNKPEYKEIRKLITLNNTIRYRDLRSYLTNDLQNAKKNTYFSANFFKNYQDKIAYYDNTANPTQYDDKERKNFLKNRK